jgi:hypothetical protein
MAKSSSNALRRARLLLLETSAEAEVDVIDAGCPPHTRSISLHVTLVGLTLCRRARRDRRVAAPRGRARCGRDELDRGYAILCHLASAITSLILPGTRGASPRCRTSGVTSPSSSNPTPLAASDLLGGTMQRQPNFLRLPRSSARGEVAADRTDASIAFGAAPHLGD